MNLARTALAGFSFIAITILAASASAQERIDFGPFFYLSSEPDRVYLDGALNEGAANLFFTGLADLPLGVTTIVLNSSDGTMVDALTVADIIWHSQLNTFVREGDTCSGPCFYSFLGGLRRAVEGTLSTKSAPEYEDDIFFIEELRSVAANALERYGVADEAITIARDLASGDEHVFTPDELAGFGINRSFEDGLIWAARQPALPDAPLPDLQTETFMVGAEAVGTLTEYDGAGNLIGEQPVSVSWHLRPDPAGVRAEITVSDPELIIAVDFVAISATTVPFFFDMITIDFDSSQPGGRPDIEFVTAIGIETASAALPVYYFMSRESLAPDAYFFGFDTFIPRVFSEIAREFYADAESFQIHFWYAGEAGRGVLKFDLSDAGRGALDTVLAAWTMQ